MMISFGTVFFCVFVMFMVGFLVGACLNWWEGKNSEKQEPYSPEIWKNPPQLTENYYYSEVTYEKPSRQIRSQIQTRQRNFRKKSKGQSTVRPSS